MAGRMQPSWLAVDCLGVDGADDEAQLLDLDDVRRRNWLPPANN